MFWLSQIIIIIIVYYIYVFLDFIDVENSATGAIAGGVAAGAALLFAALEIVLAWWLRRKPQEHFSDVPGWWF